MIDLTGLVFENLTVQRRSPVNKYGQAAWECLCICGRMTSVAGQNLRTGRQISCGCKQPHGTNRISVLGCKFGALTVIRELPDRIHGQITWECTCECGAVKRVASRDLRTGHTKSCGCKKDQWCAEANITHGHDRKGKRSSLYRVWCAMKERCTNPKSESYEHYGAKGVSVCERWMKSFGDFLADMGPRPADHSIDRINPFGNYEPSNCRWADRATQRQNTRQNYQLQ